MESANYLLPILLSALLLGFYDVAKKRAVLDNPVGPVLFWSNLCGTALLLLLFAVTGTIADTVRCSGIEYLLILGKSVLVGISWGCVYYAMRELPISVAAPVRASSPVWVLLGSLLFYREFPNYLQGLAMLSIFCGYAVFALAGKLDRIAWKKHRGIHALLLGTLLGAAAALYDKYLLNVLAISRLTLQWYFALNLIAVLGLGWLGSVKLFPHAENPKQFRWHWSIAATGILLIAADFVYFYAVSVPDAHISILSLVRRSNSVVSFALGAMLFHEKHLRVKLAALGLILLGICMLALA